MSLNWNSDLNMVHPGTEVDERGWLGDVISSHHGVCLAEVLLRKTSEPSSECVK